MTKRPLLAIALASTFWSSHALAQHVRPGDHLVVRLLGAEQPLADTLLVSDSGTVTLPKLGAISLATFQIPTLPDSLRARYAVYLRNPTVDVVVLRRIVVSGEVKKPDIYYMDVNATVPDMIAHAGGTTEFSNNRVSIRRADHVTPVPDWETSRTSLLSLQSGDEIIVGRRPWLMQNIFAAVSTLAVVASLFIALRR